MAGGSQSESLYLVDAHSLIFQVFHAVAEMTSPAGLPTNALFGFTRDLLYLRSERKPAYLVVAFDIGEPTLRTEVYADYKANRAPMPDDLRLQIPMIREMLDAMGAPVVGLAGYEADDLIATLAVAGAERGLEVFICSSDKDCRQLLSDRVKVFNVRKREVYDAAALAADWGVKPEQVVDFQTLVGDSVDNVPGAQGIGPKTASQYLQTYGTLDNLMAHLDEIKGKKQESLRIPARARDDAEAGDARYACALAVGLGCLARAGAGCAAGAGAVSIVGVSSVCGSGACRSAEAGGTVEGGGNAASGEGGAGGLVRR